MQEGKAETFVASAELIAAVIKMQSVYRGHRSRRLVKIMKRETPMRLTDDEFGYSVDGNYENEVVRQKIQQQGPF